MITISLCMIVKNEEDVLARCLDSVQGIADEIIIVDTGSTDATKQIAARYTLSLIHIWLLPVFRWIFSHSRKNRIFPLQAASAVYKAVPFLGIKKAFVSAFSNVSSLIFRSMPPAYPVSYTHLDVYKRQVLHIDNRRIHLQLHPTVEPIVDNRRYQRHICGFVDLPFDNRSYRQGLINAVTAVSTGNVPFGLV